MNEEERKKDEKQKAGRGISSLITKEWILNSGYKGFGSFFSGSVEELLQSDNYVSPTFPSFTELEAPPIPLSFGKEIKQYFYLDDEFTFINHGAFGAVPKPILQIANRWREMVEEQPLRFIDRQLLPLLVDSSRRLASVLGVDIGSLVLLPNATTALNVVIKSVISNITTHPPHNNNNLHNNDDQNSRNEGGVITKKSAVIILDCCYGSVKLMIKQLSFSKAVTILTYHVEFPVDQNEEFIISFEAFIQQHEIEYQIELAIFDHITSYAAWLLPVQSLTTTCHKHNIKVLIDGAHSLSSIPNLNITTIGADFYVGNCHKWFLSPKGCGYLYTSPQYHSIITTNTISWGCAEGGYYSQFVWDGARDYSSALCIRSILQFWDRYLGGEQRAFVYMKQLLISACDLLTTKWNTRTLFHDLHLSAAFMTLVELPLSSWRLLYDAEHQTHHNDDNDNNNNDNNNNDDGDDEKMRMATSTYGKIVQDRLFYHHRVEVPIKLINGKLYVRISVHVYNDLHDYDLLADSILHLWDDNDDDE